MRWWATLLTGWLLGSSAALGQSNDWLVLPATEEPSTDWMKPTVQQLGRELRRQGIGVWSAEAATARIETRGPRRPLELTEDEYASWRAGATETVRLLAVGDYEAALPELRRSVRFAESRLETLNRDDAQARSALDTCLYLVRALIGSGDTESAETQAQACVRASPGVEPTNFMHPPNVTALFEQAARPNAARASSLLVESEPGGCAVRVNGIAAGRTPATLEDLYPGEYRVQVECEPDSPGQVHLVQLAPGSRTLFVIESFDRAVRTQPVVHLRYDAAPDAQRLTRDTRELARALPATTTLVASPSDGDHLDLRLVRRGQLEPASVRVPVIRSESRPKLLAQAITSLLAGGCGDFTGPDPVIIDCKTGQAIEEKTAVAVATRPPRGQFIAGLTLASLGAASLLSGYGLYAARGSAGDNWIDNPQSVSAQTKWLRLGDSLRVLGPTGAGALVAAMPLILPYKSKTPWWGWLAGGVGIASIGASIALGITADAKRPISCRESGPSPDACIDRDRNVDLAILLGVTSAPLVTIPLVYLLRRGGKKLEASLSPAVRAGQYGGSLTLRGEF